MDLKHRSGTPFLKDSSRYRLLRCEPLEDRALLADFAHLGALGMAGASYGESAWGDYDNDGRLDLVVTGEDAYGAKIAKLYHNDGSDTFHEATSFTGVAASTVAWGDYDNDGRLDLALAGSDSSYNFVTKLYHNDGGGGFHEVVAGLPGVENGSIAWGDYDNDGLLDIFLAGRRWDVATFAAIYHNDGNGAFHDIAAGLVQVSDAAGAWADYDCDGWLDLLVTGQAAGQPSSQLYHNDGNGTFRAVSSGLPRFWAASVAWGDYDNDGQPDIAMTGLPDSGRMAAVFHNDGNGSFHDISAGLPLVSGGSVAWGDYDSDGRLDLLLTGYYYYLPTDYGRLALLYHNEGDGTFVQNTNAGLHDSAYGSIAWMDFDNDSKLDIMLTGTTIDLTGSENRFTRIYRNTTAAANAPPEAPSGLSATILSESSVMLSWTAPADAQTPSSGLSYVIRIGTSPGASDLLPPMSDADSGFRRLAQRGMIETTSWRFDNVVAGQTCYWSVQAVDAALAGSPFALEGSFVTPGFSEVDAGIQGIVDGENHWADYDNDGRLDLLLLGGRESTGYPVLKLYHNDGGGVFHEVAAGLPSNLSGSAAWGDYDNDGRLDLVLVGSPAIDSCVSRLYHNDGAGVFREVSANLPGLVSSCLAWGDYDNDGRLDLLLMGYSRDLSQNITRLYHNDGEGVFREVSTSLPDLGPGCAAWGDYDNDGRLDLALCGLDRTEGYVSFSAIYHNDGNGAFHDIGANLPPVGSETAAADWGDYDNDGRLDLLLVGKDVYSPAPFAKVFHNDSNGVFRDVGASLTGFEHGTAAWGDYDNDGRLDILASGNPAPMDWISYFARNDGGGRFHDIAAGLPGLVGSCACWGDYDNDGRLDAAVSGYTYATNSALTRLYHNDTVATNSPPGGPTGLSATEISPGSFLLSWTASTDNQTPAGGLSYNIRVGTTPGGCDIVGPMAGADGACRLPQRGVVQGANWTLSGLDEGVYYWSVQAVDSAFAGSAFATEGTFAYAVPRTGRDVAIDFGGSSGAWLWKDNSQWKFITAQNPVSMAAGDFDGNGQTDVALSFPSGGGTWIFFNSSTWQFAHSDTAQHIVAADVNGDGKDEAIFDFGTSGGIWEHLPATNGWKYLRAGPSMGMVCLDMESDGRDDVVVNLPGQGTRIYRNDATWQLLHATNATAMAGGDMDGDGQDELVVSFPGSGTWAYANSGAWQYLHPVTALNGAIGDVNGDRKGEVVLNLGAGRGTWQYLVATGAWKFLHSEGASLLTCADVDNNGLADVILYLGPSHGTWIVKNDSAWQFLHAAPAEAVATAYGCSPSAGKAMAKYGPDVAIGFGGSNGTWLLRNGSQWQFLHPQTAVASTVGDFDGNGQADLMLSFSGGGTWTCSNNSVWKLVNSGTAERMVAADVNGDQRDEAIVDFGAGRGIWKYLPLTGAWSYLHGGTAVSMARADVDGNRQDDVAISLSAGGTWIYRNDATWQFLHSADAATLSGGNLDGNAQDDLLLAMPGGGTWAFVNNSQWQYLHSVTALGAALGDLNGDGKAEVVLNLGAGNGTWEYVPATRVWKFLHSQAADVLTCADVDLNGRADVVLSLGSGGGTWAYRNDSTWQYLHGLAPQWIATAYGSSARSAKGLAPSAGEAAAAKDGKPITQPDLWPTVGEALAGRTAFGAPAPALEPVALAPLNVADQAGEGHLDLGAAAAVQGGFIDQTPAASKPLAAPKADNGRTAVEPAAVDRIDLLTIVEHELSQLAELRALGDG